MAREGDEAVVRAMQTAGRAVVFSGTTVAIGLLAMVVLPLPFLRSIGYAGMLIPLISVVVAVTLLPIVLAKAGNRLDWPHVRDDDQASRAWTRWARLVVRRRWFAAGGAGARAGRARARRDRLAARPSECQHAQYQGRGAHRPACARALRHRPRSAKPDRDSRARRAGTAGRRR